MPATGLVTPFERPGRNDPCACGSGRKFKKCCGVLPPGASNRVADLVAEAMRSAEQQAWPRAVQCLEAAAALQPGDGALLNNLGNALQQAGRSADALAAFQAAAARAPQLAAVQANMAATLLVLGRVDEALTHYANGLTLEPDMRTFSELLFAMNYSERVTPQQAYTAHRRFAELLEPPLLNTWPAHINAPEPGRRLRLGYVSSDLRNHSVAFFVEAVLRQHDHLQFEVFVYHNHPVEDSVSARLRSMTAHWCPIAHLSDDAVAQRIRSDGIDILVDLNGHTQGNRLPVFARKPAPVQLTWLGYPNTTGLDAIDARITDAWADPPGQTEQWHSETLVRLPGCFVCYVPPQDAPLPMPLPPHSERAVVFGSFNNRTKIGAGVVQAWSRLLENLPGSRLVLKTRGYHDASAHAGLLAQFAQHGVAAERLTILGREDDGAAHLKRYHGIDIALDTFPYAGTTTTCDALWMGVPVVTLAGQTHASRVGASLLNAVGLGELVATTLDEYVDVANRLARDLPRLHAIRSGLRERVAASPLTDSALFTRHFEAALRQLWGAWCDGLKHHRPPG